MIGVLFTQFKPRITMPLSYRDVYVELFLRADDNGLVIINKDIRDEIAYELKINVGVVSNNLTKYVKAEFLRKIENGLYEIVLFREILKIQDITLKISIE